MVNGGTIGGDGADHGDHKDEYDDDDDDDDDGDRYDDDFYNCKGGNFHVKVIFMILPS